MRKNPGISFRLPVKLPAKLPVKLNRRTGIIIGAAAVLFLLLFSLFSGCGARHGSPESVVRSLIEAYGKGNERQIRDCYGQKKEAEASLKDEINTTLAYLDAHNTKSVQIKKADALWEDDLRSCMYVIYGLELDTGQEYPCLGTYIAEKKNGKYYVLPPSQISEDLSTRTAKAYTKFMTTDTYKDYTREYNAFVKKNPGYEEKIAARMGE